MKLFKILFAGLIAYAPTAWSAVDYNIKYSFNYLIACVCSFLKLMVHRILSTQKFYYFFRFARGWA